LLSPFVVTENFLLFTLPIPKPENIEAPVNIVLETCKDQIAAVNVAKTLCKTADEMKAKAGSIIINHLARGEGLGRCSRAR